MRAPPAAVAILLLLAAALPLLAASPGVAADAACDLSGLEPARYWTYEVTRHHNDTLNTTTDVQVELVDAVRTAHGPGLRFVRTEYGSAYTTRTEEVRLAADLRLVRAATLYTWDLSDGGTGESTKRTTYAPPLPLAPCHLAPGTEKTVTGTLDLEATTAFNGSEVGSSAGTLNYSRDLSVVGREVREVPAGAFNVTVVHARDAGGAGRTAQVSAFNATVGLPVEERVHDRTGNLREHWQLAAWGRRAPDLRLDADRVHATRTDDGWTVRAVVENAGDGDAEQFTLRVLNGSTELAASTVHTALRARTALEAGVDVPDVNGTLTLEVTGVQPEDADASNGRVTFRLAEAAATRTPGDLRFNVSAVTLYPGTGGTPGVRVGVANEGPGDVESFVVTVARPGEPPFTEHRGPFMWGGADPREVTLDVPLDGLGRPRPAHLELTLLAEDARLVQDTVEVPWTLREEPPPSAGPGPSGPGVATPNPDGNASPDGNDGDANGPDLRPGERPDGPGTPARPFDGSNGDSGVSAPGALPVVLTGVAAALFACRRGR